MTAARPETATVPADLRDLLFARLGNRRFSALVTTEGDGIIAGSSYTEQKLRDHGVSIEYLLPEGTHVSKGDLVARISGAAKQITMAEEYIIGDMAKVSGIATAAAKAVGLAGPSCRVASGSWKKMPQEIKAAVRQAILIGGASPRLLDVPFVYLDKNYVRIFGGVSQALAAAYALPDHLRVIQLKGETGSLEAETREAIAGGADVIMVDTGCFDDVAEVSRVLTELGRRKKIKVAFAKDLRFADIPKCIEFGIDLLCIGKEIIDAPLMDMKLDIVSEKERFFGN